MHPQIKRRKEHGFVEGDRVYYHSIIGGPHDGVERTVEALGDLCGQSVAWLSGKRGCFSVKALSRVPSAQHSTSQE